MNKLTLKILLGLLSFGLAGCAAFFSITGLSMLFAGAALSVIIMATCLEFAKLVAASFLYRYWSKIGLVLKSYLTIAVIILALITSLGIYGFLSNAYQQTKLEYSLSRTAVDSLTTKKSTFEFQLANANKQLDFKNQQLQNFNNSSKNRDELLTTLATQNKNIRNVERNAAAQQKEISKINTEISKLLTDINILNDSILKYDLDIKTATLNSSKHSELGPLEYLSGILNIDMDQIINWFILLFVFVFDPLAMALLISFNFLGKEDEKDARPNDTLVIKQEPENNVLDDQIETQKEVVNTEPISEKLNVSEQENKEKTEVKVSNNTIYEESKKNISFERVYDGASGRYIKKPIAQKPVTNRTGYSGGISN